MLIAVLGAFYWALHNDQFDDLESPALDILSDEDLPSTAEKSEGDSA